MASMAFRAHHQSTVSRKMSMDPGWNLPLDQLRQALLFLDSAARGNVSNPGARKCLVCKANLTYLIQEYTHRKVGTEIAQRVFWGFLARRHQQVIRWSVANMIWGICHAQVLIMGRSGVTPRQKRVVKVYLHPRDLCLEMIVHRARVHARCHDTQQLNGWCHGAWVLVVACPQSPQEARQHRQLQVQDLCFPALMAFLARVLARSLDRFLKSGLQRTVSLGLAGYPVRSLRVPRVCTDSLVPAVQNPWRKNMTRACGSHYFPPLRILTEEARTIQQHHSVRKQLRTSPQHQRVNAWALARTVLLSLPCMIKAVIYAQQG